MNLNDYEEPGLYSESDELADDNCCPDYRFSDMYQFDGELAASILKWSLIGLSASVLLGFLSKGKTVNVNF